MWWATRLARIEDAVVGVREDVAALTTEQIRTRDRLHNIEGVQAIYLEAQKDNRRKEEAQYQRLGLRIQILTLVVGLAAVAVPVIVILLSGK